LFQEEGRVRRAASVCRAYYSQCAGYLAYSDKEITLLVALRGSESTWQVIKEVLESLAVPKKQFLDGEVQSHFNRGIRLKDYVPGIPGIACWSLATP
jgi:hypothetical protein